MLRRSLVLFALLTLPAHAQEESDALASDTSRRVRYQDVTHIDIDVIDIEGTVVKPEINLLPERVRARFSPLITLRRDFADAMEASVDEVR